MQKAANDIVIFLVVVSLLIVTLVAFVIFILYMYRRKQAIFLQNLEQIKLKYEKMLLAAQVEMQEETFEHISREIHDNITLTLTLAKLRLNTIDLLDRQQSAEKIDSSIELLGQSIKDLSELSKGLNADFIRQLGLINVIEEEIQQIRQTGLFTVDSIVTGELVYMDAKKELLIFRIIQEAFNNIIKHAAASHTELSIHYNKFNLYLAISDNGNGFETTVSAPGRHAGLKNMATRVKILDGSIDISSEPGDGTLLSIIIPLQPNGQQ